MKKRRQPVFEDLITQAESEVATIEPAEAIGLLGRDGVAFIDLRDGFELNTHGQLPGSFHCPRGSLEFRADAASPFFRSCFDGPERFVFYCSHGMRSALAARTAQELGLKSVCHIRGGMNAWVEVGGPVENGRFYKKLLWLFGKSDRT